MDTNITNLITTAREANAFIKALLDGAPDEATDLLTNYGHRIENDLHFALMRLPRNGSIQLECSLDSGDEYTITRPSITTIAIVNGLSTEGCCSIDAPLHTDSQARIRVLPPQRAQFAASFSACFGKQPPTGCLPVILPIQE